MVKKKFTIAGNQVFTKASGPGLPAEAEAVALQPTRHLKRK
jgi:hypothetical protein